MIKRIFLYILIFIFIGELMIRFDKYFLVLETNRIVKISTNIEITPEYEMLKNNTFPISENDLRIMVIGDSYIHGGGIEFKNNFSQQLKKMFNDSIIDYSNVWILDVSKPSSNNLDHNQTYFQFVNRFNPDIVIIGYNINDISGNLTKKKNVSNIKEFNKIKVSGSKAQSLIKKINNIIYTSDFIQFSMHKLHNELKNIGVIIPGSEFDYTMKSYYQNKDNWKKSKKLLDEIIKDIEKRKSLLIVYKFPEINLLEHQELFEKANISIANFFNKYNSIIYKDGSLCFKGEKSKDYILSKYDGHPNEKAHYKMAKDVFEIINKEYTQHNRVDGSD